MASKEVESSTKRHCAFCLKLKPHKLCSGCHRRAYCSVECQRQDWVPLGKGQGHKNYCKIEHGQEDLDWEVKPVHGKGLGILAKRRLPAMYRILIEAAHYSADSHPGIDDLTPQGGTLLEKFMNNSAMSNRRNCFVLGLRTSRVNHSCSANAAGCHCPLTDVLILYACRDIEEGEEICRNYIYINELELPLGLPLESIQLEPVCATVAGELSMAKRIINNLGITCPRSCVCRRPEYYSNFSKLRKLQTKMKQQEESDPARAFELAEEIVNVLNALNASWTTKCCALYQAAEIAAKEPALYSICFERAEKATEIMKALCPLSPLYSIVERGLDFYRKHL